MQYPVLNKESIAAQITETRAKIPLLLKGNWNVTGFGLMSVTDEYIDKLTDNFKSNVLGFVPYATLGHLTDSPDPASIDGERKRGDLKEIVREGDIVYGIYDINAETYQLLKNRDYEYSSPEIQQNFRDKVTGELKGPTLLRTALTNAPFMPFNDNKIVTLSQQNDDNNTTSVYIKLSTNTDNIIQADEVKQELSESPIQTIIETPPLVETETITTVELVQPVELIELKTEVLKTTEIITEPLQIKTQDIKMPTNTNESVSTPEVKDTVITPIQSAPNSFDLEAILNKVIASQQVSINSTIEALTSKFNETLEAVNTKTAETIASIANKVDELATQVSTVAVRADEIDRTSQYITALSSSEKAKEMNSKLNNLFEKHNVSPAALSLAKSIITNATGDSIVKLSVNGTDKEVSLEDSLIELIKLSSNVAPNEIQLGAQSAPPKASYINNVIEANLAKAKAGK